MSEKISGRTIAKKIKEGVALELEGLKKTPGIVAVLVGNDPASHLYVKIKEKECMELGIHFEKLIFPENLSEEELINSINSLNSKNSVDAILIQLPLPKHINADKAIEAILPEKDVDGFRLNNPHVRPVLVEAVEEIIASTKVVTKNKKMSVICNSEIFCTNMKTLSGLGLNVTCISAKQINASPQNKMHVWQEASKADFLLVAAGSPKLVGSNMVKEGAVVIDVGTNKTPEGTVGDVAPIAYKKTSFYTPVPGGVGPVTVAVLLRNVVKLAKLHQQN